MLFFSNEVIDTRSVVSFAVVLFRRSLKEPQNDPCEIIRLDVERWDDAKYFIVVKEALIKTLVQEIIVKNYDFVHCFYVFQIIAEFVVVWLKYFEEHVIKVILAELLHLQPSSESSSK